MYRIGEEKPPRGYVVIGKGFLFAVGIGKWVFPQKKTRYQENVADMVIFYSRGSNRTGWDNRQPWQNGHGGRCVRILAIRRGEKRRICRKKKFVGVAVLAACFAGMALPRGHGKRNAPSGKGDRGCKGRTGGSPAGNAIL
jgi:hypothetical protein